jgi:catechol 2,3-dioxygenase-like lactoylglutathione lyase family enzyme
MIDHLGINCADYAKAQEFYDRVLGVLSYSRQMDFGEAIGYGTEGHPDFWIAEGVGAFHDAAIELGAESSPANGRCPQHAPRLWPEYHAGYFAAFVRDPDGNNVEAVCHA